MPGRPAAPASPAPALHRLIGEARAQALDTRFGSLQPVRVKGGDEIHAWECDAAGKPLVHARCIALPDARGKFPDLADASLKDKIDLDALKRGEKRYIWAVGAPGRLLVGEEEPAGTNALTGKPQYRGHPLLVAGGPARICGELGHNPDSGRFTVVNKSGRYSRYADRAAPQLNEVASLFARAGLAVETAYLRNKAPEPLVLPSLAPAFAHAAGAKPTD
jgi:hypothetical protein